MMPVGQKGRNARIYLTGLIIILTVLCGLGCCVISSFVALGG